MAIGTQTVFEIANVVAREPIYHVTNYSLQGGEIRSSLGVSVMTRPADSNATADTWMISGVANPTGRTTTAEELRFISEAAARSRRTAGLCTGAFVLAEAGLLNGKRATTHWAFADALQARWPLVQVEADRIFIVDGPIWTSAGLTADVDGPIWTSAGLTAAMDLALGLVEKDMGADFATRVARAMVMTHRRSGGQSQHSEMLALAPKSDRVQKALEHARLNLSKPLRVDDLAKAA
jgi:transcriptional regulator GlxA family with amidase domain